MTDSSLLWQLQPPHGQPRWLFGSMHIRDNRVYRYGEKLFPLIQQADVYVGEMELDMQDQIPFNQTYDLKKQLSANAFDKIRKQLLKSFQLDIEQYVHLHPLLTISAISQSGLAAEHQVSLDEHLWNFAKANEIRTQGLESYTEQAQILHNLDPGPLYKQLFKISRSPSSISQQAHKTLNWYMKGDIHQLYRMTKSSMHGLRKQIIYDRNRIMVNRILEYDEMKKYFIVVGAGHLSGKYGLIALLKKSKWKVRPLHLTWY